MLVTYSVQQLPTKKYSVDISVTVTSGRFLCQKTKNKGAKNK